MSSQPIRVGLIGLSINTGSMGPGVWAAIAHVSYLLASPKYHITAVNNSTIESAQASIDHYNLGAHVKAYGNPSDLAADPNVDLIVVCVKVEHHYTLTTPALLAGKNVFVEWPLCSTTSEAKELAQLASANGSKTIIGTQALASPLVLKLKSLLSSNTIGDIISTTVTGDFNALPSSWFAGAEYFLSMKKGGNSFTIFFGHFLDSFLSILGPFKDINESELRTDNRTISIIDDKGNIVDEGFPKDTPDYIHVQGRLESGAGVEIEYTTSPADGKEERKGKGKDDVVVRWVIVGSEGRIEITIPEGGQWQMTPPGTTLKITNSKGEVQNIDFDKLEEGREEVEAVKATIWPGRNTARLYEAFAEGRAGSYSDVDGAVKTHEVLDMIREKAGW